MLQSLLDSILQRAKKQKLENISLEDDLESFLCSRRQLQTKCMVLCWRMEDDASIDPLRIRNTPRTSPTQGLQTLQVKMKIYDLLWDKCDIYNGIFHCYLGSIQ